MDCEEKEVPGNDSEWEALIEAWITAIESGRQRSDYDPYDRGWWSVDCVGEWHLDDLHEPLWEFILRTFEREMSDKTFAILAAGPLEDLLACFGELYIDRVEDLARKSPRFNFLLGGVWKNAMTDTVWNRIQAARLTVW